MSENTLYRWRVYSFYYINLHPGHYLSQSYNVWRQSYTLSAELFFRLLDFNVFEITLLESSKIFVEHALLVARIHFRTQALYSCAGKKGSYYDYRYIIKRMLVPEKLVWREGTRSTSLEVWIVATSKAWRVSGRTAFSSPWWRRKNEALIAGCQSYWCCMWYDCLISHE